MHESDDVMEGLRAEFERKAAIAKEAREKANAAEEKAKVAEEKAKEAREKLEVAEEKLKAAENLLRTSMAKIDTDTVQNL